MSELSEALDEHIRSIGRNADIDNYDRKLLEVILLELLETKEIVKKIMATTPTPQWQTDMLAEVQAQTTVGQSAIVLLQKLFAAAQASGQDPTAFVEAQLASMKANDQAIGDAIIANTPAAPAATGATGVASASSSKLGGPEKASGLTPDHQIPKKG